MTKIYFILILNVVFRSVKMCTLPVQDEDEDVLFLGSKEHYADIVISDSCVTSW
jgi:hypothetical protein